MRTSLLAVSMLALAASAGRAQEEALPTVPAADAAAVQKINQLGGGALPVAANTQALSVNFSLAGAKIDDAALESLKGVADQVVWLNLGGTAVTDAGLKALAGLKNLRRLHLERTGTGDAGVEHLKGLADLQYLNLYGTKVTDAAVASLSGLKKLKSLYLWQTAVTEAGAETLKKALPGCYVNRGVDPPAKVVEIPKPEGPKAINAKCPVSGKDVDAAVTFTHEGQLIAFCCKDCCGQFAKEPAKFIDKVENFKKGAAKPDPKKAVNAKCPVSGKDVDPAVTFKYKDQLVGFCCKNCCGQFAKEPEKFAAKVEGLKK
jgi:YHS domain-containing protein